MAGIETEIETEMRQRLRGHVLAHRVPLDGWNRDRDRDIYGDRD